MYAHGDIILIIIMNCRIPTEVEFRTKLGFKQHQRTISANKNNKNIGNRKNDTTAVGFLF